MLPVIQTRRLQLRPLTESDLSAYQTIVGDARVAIPAGLLAPVSPQQARASFDNDRQQPVSYALVWSQTNQVIGTLLGYEHGDATGAPDPMALDLGYLLRADFWGQGLMTEALTAWVANLQAGPTALTTLYATCFATNVGSQHVLNKAKFTLIDDAVMVLNPMTGTLIRELLYQYHL